MPKLKIVDTPVQAGSQRMSDDDLRAAVALEAICPERAEAKATERRLLAAAATAEREARSLHAELNAKTAARAEERLDDEALLLMEGEEDPGDWDSVLAELQRRHSAARHREKVARRALDLHRAKDRTRNKASEIACTKVRAEYERTLADIAHAVIALCKAQAEYRRLTDALDDANVLWRDKLPQPDVPNFGTLHDPHSRHARFLYQAVALGFIDPADAPWLDTRPAYVRAYGGI